MLKKSMVELNHYIQDPYQGKIIKQVIVLLHGYGSNGRDLISLAPYWKQSAPNAAFVSPDAPFPCETGIGYQWFSLAPRTQEEYLADIEETHDILNDYLDKVLREHGLEDHHLALVGFSQGTMMSLYTGPRRKGRIAGILGYSGNIIGEETLKTYNRPPVHLIHGEADSVVPIDSYHKTVKLLKRKGFRVSGYTTPELEHSIDSQGIESGAEFISEIFS